MMHYFYGVAQGVARETARLYRQFAERQPGPAVQRFLDHRVFVRLHNSFLGVIPGFRGREPGRVNRDDEDVIVEELRRDPTTYKPKKMSIKANGNTQDYNSKNYSS
ncbi:unnamed protein product [Colias eurytheme]|nr:unnamed protein product [Colias eurytheme]